jgi:hypothetical protein
MNTFLNLHEEKESLKSFGVYWERLHNLKNKNLIIAIYNRGISEQYNAMMSAPSFGYEKRLSRRAKFQLIIRRIF